MGESPLAVCTLWMPDRLQDRARRPPYGQVRVPLGQEPLMHTSPLRSFPSRRLTAAARSISMIFHFDRRFQARKPSIFLSEHILRPDTI